MMVGACGVQCYIDLKVPEEAAKFVRCDPNSRATTPVPGEKGRKIASWAGC